MALSVGTNAGGVRMSAHEVWMRCEISGKDHNELFARDSCEGSFFSVQLL